jgi:hypothetical protein
MGKIFCLFLIFAALLTGCGQSGQGDADVIKQLKISLDGELITLSQPSLLKNDIVYITLEDMAGLPGIKIDYDKSTGKITATRNEASLTMQIDQPLKPGDINGPTPFLNQGRVYLPFRDTLHNLNYNSQQETAADGTIVITLEKLGYDVADLYHRFDDNELKAAEAALAKGITIADPQNDWAPISEGVQPDGRMDNGNPYPISFTDVKSVTLGADSQYFYVKVDLYGIIPADVTYWENKDQKKTDFIHGFGCNVVLDRFFNRNTGKEDTGMMQLGLSYIEGNIWGFMTNPVFYTPPVVGLSSYATPSGIKDERNEELYSTTSGQGLVAGGAGTNYVIGAFPLSTFGLQPGDVVELEVSMETGSLLFHHECVDVILDSGYKAGDTIRYKLGSDTYENLGPPQNMIKLTPAAS